MSRKINIKKLSGRDPEPISKKLLNSGKEENQNKSSPEEIYCPVLKHKVHCSQLEGTEASKLPEERRYEFCLNKCPVYRNQKQNIKEDG